MMSGPFDTHKIDGHCPHHFPNQMIHHDAAGLPLMRACRTTRAISRSAMQIFC